MTSLNTVVTALTSTFTAADVPDLTVTDGPYVPKKLPTSQLCEVGWAGDGEDAIQIIRGQTSAGAVGGLDRVTVWSLLSAWKGDVAKTAAEGRSVLDGSLATLIAAIEADPSLGGIGTAVFEQLRYVPTRMEGGVLAGVLFAISVTAWAD